MNKCIKLALIMGLALSGLMGAVFGESLEHIKARLAAELKDSTVGNLRSLVTFHVGQKGNIKINICAGAPWEIVGYSEMNVALDEFVKEQTHLSDEEAVEVVLEMAAEGLLGEECQRLARARGKE